MAKSTSVSRGDHVEELIGRQIACGQYGSASEVVRVGLRLIAEHETRVEALRQTLVVGEQSSDVGELDIESVKNKVRSKALRTT